MKSKLESLISEASQMAIADPGNRDAYNVIVTNLKRALYKLNKVYNAPRRDTTTL